MLDIFVASEENIGSKGDLWSNVLLMPCLKAVVQPLAGKIGEINGSSQIKHKAIALFPHDFSYFFPFRSAKKSTIATLGSLTWHTTKIKGVAGSNGRNTASKLGISYMQKYDHLQTKKAILQIKRKAIALLLHDFFLIFPLKCANKSTSPRHTPKQRIEPKLCVLQYCTNTLLLVNNLGWYSRKGLARI